MSDAKAAKANRFLFPALITLFIALAFFPELFMGRTFGAPDLYAQNNPRHAMLAEALRHGRVPLWTTRVQTGSPFAADGGSGVFYPLSLVFLFGSVARAEAWFTVLHIWIAAMGMFSLCRRLRNSNEASAIGAAAFALCGAHLAHAEHPMFLATAAWLPWMMLTLDMAIARRRARDIAPAAAIFGIVCSYAYPPVLIYALPAALLYVVVQGPAGLRKYAMYLGACLGGFAIAALPLVLTFRQVLESPRGGGGADWFLMGSFHPAFLVQTVFPFFFGVPYTASSWWPSGDQEMVFFVGMGAFLCGVLALRGRMDRNRAFALLLIVVSLFVALGSYNPAYRLLSHIPLLNIIRIPARAMWILSFGMALLAATGADSLRDNRAKRFLNGTIFRFVSSILVLTFIEITAVSAYLAPKIKPEILQSLTSALLAKNVGMHPFSFYLHKMTELYGVWSLCGIVVANALILFLYALRSFADNRISFKTARTVLMVAVCLEMFSLRLLYNQRVPDSAMNGAPPTAAAILKDKSFFRIFPGDITESLGKACDNGLFGSDCVPAFRSGLGLDTPMPYGIHSIGGFGTIPLRRYMEMYAYPDTRKGKSLPSKTSPLALDPVFHRNVLNLLGVRYVIMSKEAPLPYRRQYRNGKITVYENPGAMPRAWLVGRTVEMSPDKDLKYIYGKKYAPAREATLNHNEGKTSCGDKIDGKVVIENDAEETLEMNIQSPCDAWLIVSDAWAPDWTAERNGKPARLLIANHSMRAVRLAAGENKVRMAYRPRWMNALIGISMGALALCWAAAGFGAFARRFI